MNKYRGKNLEYLKNIRIAHRGLWNSVYPENSLGAFKRCVDRGVAIELDVHILKDNTLVVFHDYDTYRMTGKKLKLRDCCYDDIKDLKLKNTNYNIPKLDDVINLVSGKVLLDIEIKFNGKDYRICKEICRYLDKYKGKFIIKSFNPLCMLWFRIYRFNYVRGILIPKFEDNIYNYLKYKLLEIVNNFDFIVTDYRNLVGSRYIGGVIKKNIYLLIYTIKEKDINNYLDYGLIYEE